MNIIQQETINFINNDLIPEMVYNRCFCDSGSREFIEFDSIILEPLKEFNDKNYYEIYRGKLIIKFSGESKIFYIIIKLLSNDLSVNDKAYGCFINEEMFYNKIIAEYKFDIYPKCYVADMGRYGRPVIVLEDLEAIGYLRCSDVLLDDDHMKLCLNAISKFHAHGVKLKKNKFEKFREFYAKIIDINSELINTTSLINKRLEIAFENIKKNINEMTICHGEFNNNHLVFLYDKCKPAAVKIFGWNKIKYTSPIIDLKCILNNNSMIKTNEGENKNESIEKIIYIEQCIQFYSTAYVNEFNE